MAAACSELRFSKGRVERPLLPCFLGAAQTDSNNSPGQSDTPRCLGCCKGMHKTRTRNVFTYDSPPYHRWRLARVALSSAVLASSVAACADSDPIDGDSIDGDRAPVEEEVDDTPSPLRWTSCPTGFEERCARIEVPLNRQLEDSERIEVQISKRAAKGKPEAQLWLLMGGPGNSADLFEYLGTLDKFAKALPGVDIYTIEHRGVGESTKLECPNGDPTTSQEIEACVSAINDQYHGQLAAFSTTEAARDVEYALSLTRDERIPQFLYGVSYGTYLAQRYPWLKHEEPNVKRRCRLTAIRTAVKRERHFN